MTTSRGSGDLIRFGSNLLGDDGKFHELHRTEIGRDGDVGGITAARHDDAADPRMVVARIEGEPAAVEIDLEPGAEIHRRGIDGYADIAEIAGAVACRDIHAAARYCTGYLGDIGVPVD